MAKSPQPTATTRGSPDEPTQSSIDDEDPFTDDDVTSLLDDAWDRLQG